MSLNRTVLALCSIGFGAACVSPVTMVAPRPPEHYERLGPAEGDACGVLLLFASAYEFIPAGLNSRVARAYNEDVNQPPTRIGRKIVDLIQQSAAR